MTKNNSSLVDKKLTLVEHLTDLRKCILRALFGWFVGIILVFFFADQIYFYLTEPLGVTDLVYIAPVEGFITYLRLAVYGGLVLASPVVIFQLIRFLLPGLYREEKRVLFALIPGAFLLMLGGMAFGYFVVLPIALKYLLNFGAINIRPMLSVQKYIGFVTNTLIILGVIFEMPLLIMGLTKLGVVTPQFLRKKRKYAIVLAVVAGALLTPPDVFTQLLMAGPLLLLYEISIWISYIFWRKRKKKKEQLIGDV